MLYGKYGADGALALPNDRLFDEYQYVYLCEACKQQEIIFQL